MEERKDNAVSYHKFYEILSNATVDDDYETWVEHLELLNLRLYEVDVQRGENRQLISLSTIASKASLQGYKRRLPELADILRSNKVPLAELESTNSTRGRKVLRLVPRQFKDIAIDLLNH